MSCSLPEYYTSLAPFGELFASGNPALTYHKLGPRPRGARIKGLYLSAGLFRRQLAELRAAGFTSGSLVNCAGPRTDHHVVITFDDGYVNALRHGLEPLRETGFKAINFLVAGLLGKRSEWDIAAAAAPEPLMDAAQVREWLAAGHDIGSHSLTHPFLTRVPTDRGCEEIFASKKKLEDLFGRAVEHFCYPYGDWNEAVRDLVAEAGYRTACTTEFGVNDAGTSPFALKRITARYRSWNWKEARAWLARCWHALSNRH
jgi:peptidoglycan/xylan/chitin deacetylase (PgdA/CDA1 family)